MMNRTSTRIAALGVIVALVGAACGGGSSSEAGADGDGSEVIEGSLVDQDDVFVDQDDIVAPANTQPPNDDGGGGAAEGGDGGDDSEDEGTDPSEAPDDTIPQNEEDEGAVVDNLFSAMRIFSDCLDDEGHSFIGPPSPDAEPDDPVNDSGYLEALGKCAALSNIQDAFASFTEASEDLDSDEIFERNEGLVIWAECLEGRGWTLGPLEPDSRGLLQPTGIEPPAGESLLDSPAMQDCAARAQEEVAEGENEDE